MGDGRARRQRAGRSGRWRARGCSGGALGAGPRGNVRALTLNLQHDAVAGPQRRPLSPANSPFRGVRHAMPRHAAMRTLRSYSLRPPAPARLLTCAALLVQRCVARNTDGRACLSPRRLCSCCSSPAAKRVRRSSLDASPAPPAGGGAVAPAQRRTQRVSFGGMTSTTDKTEGPVTRRRQVHARSAACRRPHVTDRAARADAGCAACTCP